MGAEHGEVDHSPSGPVAAISAWIQEITALAEAGDPEWAAWRGFNLDEWGVLSHRRPLPDGEEIIVYTRLDSRVIATPETGYRPMGEGLNFRVRRTEDGWEILGFAPIAL